MPQAPSTHRHPRAAMPLLRLAVPLAVALAALAHTFPTAAQPAAPLVVAAPGKAPPVVVVSPTAGPWEKKAAAEVVRCVGLMTGTEPKLANTADAVDAAIKGGGRVIVVGGAALKVDPSLAAALAKVAKKEPVLRADAIALRRQGDRVLVVGTN